MGEGRGKLEALIVDLEAKKAELEKLIQEYELMLPHLSSARDALDKAGITESIAPSPEAIPVPAPQPQATAVAAEAAPAAEPAPTPAPAEAAPETPAEEAPAEAAPARRSIASLVAEDDAAGDEATH